jgi:hypothetical protein
MSAQQRYYLPAKLQIEVWITKHRSHWQRQPREQTFTDIIVVHALQQFGDGRNSLLGRGKLDAAPD